MKLRRLTYLLTTVIAVGALGSTASYAAGPNHEQADPNTTSTCPAGSVMAKPERVRTLAGGGSARDFILSGVRQTQFTPPQGFTPLTATAAKLMEYHFPARPPASGPGLAAWKSQMSAYKGAATPGLCQHMGSATGVAEPSGVPAKGLGVTTVGASTCDGKACVPKFGPAPISAPTVTPLPRLTVQHTTPTDLCVATPGKGASTGSCATITPPGGWPKPHVQRGPRTAPAHGVQPANNSDYIIGILADPLAVAPGHDSTITVHDYSGDIGPTPYYLMIFDESNHTSIAVCGSGTDCSATVSESVAVNDTFMGYVASYCNVGCTEPPPGEQSQTVAQNVTWLSTSITASQGYTAAGDPVTLTATDNTINHTTNISLTVYEEPSGMPVFACDQGPHTGDSTCSGTVMQTTGTSNSYRAVAEDETNSATQADTKVQSADTNVTWLQLSLTSDSGYVRDSNATNLVASVNSDVGPSPYYVSLYDVTSSPKELAVCGAGLRCSAPVMNTLPGTYSFEAEITSEPDTLGGSAAIATQMWSIQWVALPADGTVQDIPNWSGQIATPSPAATQVGGSWTQSAARNTGTSDESTWVGLGGAFGSGALMQNGTDLQDASMFAWYEYLHPCPSSNEACNPAEISVTHNVQPGDIINATTTYDTSSNSASFYMTDNGITIENIMTSLDSSYYDGSTAEYVNERPAYGPPNPYEALTDYGTQVWGTGNHQTFASAPGNPTPGTVTTLAQSNSFTAVMDGSSAVPATCANTNALAVPTPVDTAGNFTSVWCAAGP